MKTQNKELNKFRVRTGFYSSDDKYGTTGAFSMPSPFGLKQNILIVSSGVARDDNELTKWEHVSASLKKRCPTWAEMSFVKDLFWRDDEVIVQYHPAKEHYISNHGYCLHLWKPPYEVFMPPSIAIGKKNLGVLHK